MRLKLDESEAPVQFGVRLFRINYHLDDSVDDPYQLGLDLLRALVLGDVAEEEPAVVERDVHRHVGAPRLAPDAAVVETQDGLLGVRHRVVVDEGEAPGPAGEVHHEAQLVYGAYLGEQRDQLVFVKVPRQVAHEDFAAFGQGRAGGRRRVVNALAVALDDGVRDFVHFFGG